MPTGNTFYGTMSTWCEGKSSVKGGLLMLKDFVKAEKPQEEELKQRIREEASSSAESDQRA